MRKKPSRIYLPRSTVAMKMIIAVEWYSKKKNLSFGKALELMLSESVTCNNILNELIQDAPWLDD